MFVCVLYIWDFFPCYQLCSETKFRYKNRDYENIYSKSMIESSAEHRGNRRSCVNVVVVAVKFSAVS